MPGAENRRRLRWGPLPIGGLNRWDGIDVALWSVLLAVGTVRLRAADVFLRQPPRLAPQGRHHRSVALDLQMHGRMVDINPDTQGDAAQTEADGAVRQVEALFKGVIGRKQVRRNIQTQSAQFEQTVHFAPCVGFRQVEP